MYAVPRSFTSLKRLSTAVAVIMAMSALVPSTRAEAEPTVPPIVDVCNGDWTPILRDVTVNQGLGTYNPLARGKTTMVRLYLSQPQCAPPRSEELVSATLTARDGSTQLVSMNNTVGYFPGDPTLDSYLDAPTPDGTGNPTFLIPEFGSNDPNSGTFTATFTATVTYRYQVLPTMWSQATVSYSQTPGGTSPIQATVAPKPHALRVLLVPMGDASQPRSTQFPTATNGGTPVNGQYADTIVHAGMRTVSRLMPIADGIGDLMSTTAGLRYHLDDTSMIDLGPRGLNLMPGGTFCGHAGNFAYPTAGPNLSGQLTTFLNNWNTTRANRGAQADRVVGVVWQGISRGVSDGCSEGMASTGGIAAWARVFAGNTVGLVTPNPSLTGALLAHELSHTLGSLPLSDPRNYLGDHHSVNISADPHNTKRGYNTTTLAWIPDSRSDMHWSGNSTGYTNSTTGEASAWDNETVLFEREDYLFNQCQLTPGMTSSQCPSTTSIGSIGTF